MILTISLSVQRIRRICLLFIVIITLFDSRCGWVYQVHSGLFSRRRTFDPCLKTVISFPLKTQTSTSHLYETNTDFQFDIDDLLKEFEEPKVTSLVQPVSLPPKPIEPPRQDNEVQQYHETSTLPRLLKPWNRRSTTLIDSGFVDDYYRNNGSDARYDDSRIQPTPTIPRINHYGRYFSRDLPNRYQRGSSPIALHPIRQPQKPQEEEGEVFFDDKEIEMELEGKPREKKKGIIQTATKNIEEDNVLENNGDDLYIDEIPKDFFRKYLPKNLHLYQQSSSSSSSVDPLPAIFKRVSFATIRKDIQNELGLSLSSHVIHQKLLSFLPFLNNQNNRRTSTYRPVSKIRNALNNENRPAVLLPVDEKILVKGFIELSKISEVEVIRHLMFYEGLTVSINQMIHRDYAIRTLIAYHIPWIDSRPTTTSLSSSNEDMKIDEDLTFSTIEKTTSKQTKKQKTKRIISRSPIVTIMGHVDHGKTTLLDAIRNTSVTKQEAGGITQTITAFNVQALSGRNITFIDTPGHAAFRAMRRRGAHITDIVILVIAADDGIMEQTIESIHAAKEANCPIVIAINKIDKEDANPDYITTSLTQHGITVEKLGGETQCAEISAKQNQGINDLLECVILQADLMELKAELDEPLEATVIESQVEKGFGPVVTALISKGIIQRGQYLVAGSSYGKVRFLFNDQGEIIKQGFPAQPIRIIGMTSVPSAGDKIIEVADEETCKQLTMNKLSVLDHKSLTTTKTKILQEFSERIESRNTDPNNNNNDKVMSNVVSVIIKADVIGSLEAIKYALQNITLDEDIDNSRIEIIHEGIGDITSSDIKRAESCKAKIIGFNVQSSLELIELARSQNIEIKHYNILYKIIDDFTALLSETHSLPPPPGFYLGRAQVLKVFKISNKENLNIGLNVPGKIAGCLVKDGIMISQVNIRIIRNRQVIYNSGILASLKIGKEDMTEVNKGQECGIQIKGFVDFEEGDIIECFQE